MNTLLYPKPLGMDIIMSAASVYVPFPKLQDLTSRQHCLPAPYVRQYVIVRVPTLLSELAQRTLLLGSSHPPLRLSPLLPSGCKADGSRLNQHKACLSCRGRTAAGHVQARTGQHMSRQVTLSSSRNLDHAQTADQTASLAL